MIEGCFGVTRCCTNFAIHQLSNRISIHGGIVAVENMRRVGRATIYSRQPGSERRRSVGGHGPPYEKEFSAWRISRNIQQRRTPSSTTEMSEPTDTIELVRRAQQGRPEAGATWP